MYTTQTSPSCQASGLQQLLKNPSFELGTAYWTVKNQGVGKMTWTARKDTAPIAGRNVARIDSQNTDSTSHFRMSQVVATCPGLLYAWSQVDKQFDNSGCFVIVEKDSLEIGAGPGSASWSQSVYYFSADSTSAMMTIDVQCTGSRTVKSQFFDNLQLSQAG
jgi:hypothetical protein